MRNRPIAFLILLLLCVSCKLEKEKENLVVQFQNKKQLGPGRPLKLEGIIGNPLTIMVKDSMLIINEFRDDFLLYFYNLKNGNLLKKTGVVGQGPDEFMPPLGISLSHDKNILKIFARRGFFYSEYKIGDSLEFNIVSQAKHFGSNNQNLYQINKNSFLGIGIYDKGRFCLYDSLSREIGNFADFPDIKINTGSENKTIKNDVKAMIFQARIGIRPDTKRFAVANFYTGILEIYELGSDTINKIAEKRANNTNTINLKNFSSGSTLRVELSDSEPNGFSDMYVSDHYIFALYSGRTIEKFPNNNYLGNSIMVFDWEGNPINWYETDKALRCFTINEERHKLYAISEDEGGEYELLEFNLD